MRHSKYDPVVCGLLMNVKMVTLIGSQCLVTWTLAMHVMGFLVLNYLEIPMTGPTKIAGECAAIIALGSICGNVLLMRQKCHERLIAINLLAGNILLSLFVFALASEMVSHTIKVARPMIKMG